MNIKKIRKKSNEILSHLKLPGNDSVIIGGRTSIEMYQTIKKYERLCFLYKDKIESLEKIIEKQGNMIDKLLSIVKLNDFHYDIKNVLKTRIIDEV